MKKEEVKEVQVIKDNSVKTHIIIFAIGVLVGAIIATGIFLIARGSDDNKIPDFNNFGNIENVKPNDKNFNFDKKQNDYRNRDDNQKEIPGEKRG